MTATLARVLIAAVAVSINRSFLRSGVGARRGNHAMKRPGKARS